MKRIGEKDTAERLWIMRCSLHAGKAVKLWYWIPDFRESGHTDFMRNTVLKRAVTDLRLLYKEKQIWWRPLLCWCRHKKEKAPVRGESIPGFFVSEEERTFEIKPWGIYRKTIWLFWIHCKYSKIIHGIRRETERRKYNGKVQKTGRRHYEQCGRKLVLQQGSFYSDKKDSDINWWIPSVFGSDLT